MSTSASDQQDQRNQDQRNARQAELEATRRQIEAYQALLQEVPTVFERKFRERMQSVLERNREIAAESQLLREQLNGALPPGASGEVAQIPSDTGRSTTTKAADPAALDPPALEPNASKASALRADAADHAPGSPEGKRERPRLWLRSPRRRLRPLLWGAAGITVLGLSLLTLGPLVRHWPQAQFLKMLMPTPADPNALGPEELQIISQGSWVEVEDASGSSLYAGILEGERRFTIGPGLRLNAGRPDLVRYRIGQRPFAPLGAIEDVGWRTLASPLNNPAAVPALESDLPQP
jgi:hypothetical protein